MLLCSHAHASPRVALSGVPVCPCPLSFVPPLALTCLAWGPLHPPGWAPIRRRAQHTPFGGGGVQLCPPPPLAHRGPLTDSSASQYARWGAARGHWALRGHSWVPLMSPRAAVPDPPVCGCACPAGGVSVCLACPGFGAPFVCLGFARPCCSPQGCECHRQLRHALDLCPGSFVHIERFLWSSRWSGVKIHRKMARLCSSFHRAPWPVPCLRSWLLRAAGLLFFPFRSVLGLPLLLTLRPPFFPIFPQSLEVLPYVQQCVCVRACVCVCPPVMGGLRFSQFTNSP